MRKNFGKQTWMYPLPVLLIATYDENGNPDIMNAAWGGIYDTNTVQICLGSHQTTDNIRESAAFTIGIADAAHVAEADYVGIVSKRNTPDKIEKTGFTLSKSEFVNAPIINEIPMVIECNLIKFNEDGNVIGEIVNISADESILNEEGRIDPAKLQPIAFDPVNNLYHKLGEPVGHAFSDGKKLS